MTTKEFLVILASFSGLFTFLLTAMGLYFTRRDKGKQERRETTEERVNREAKEREADIDRYDKGVWRLMDEMKAEIANLKAEVKDLKARTASLEAEKKAVELENIDLRAEKMQMKNTIGQLTRRVAEIEKHEKEGKG